MGVGDFIRDLTPDSVEDVVEDGVEWAGDRAEDAGDWTADRLEDVGWESGADWVREKSRSLANRMGAEVDEMDLGQTEDKTKLIYGSASKIRGTSSHLNDLQASFRKVGEGLKGLDSSAIKGQAADTFRETVSIEPPKWFKGADAFEKAAQALETFATTVEWAQGQAQIAIDTWKAGTKASAEALDVHNGKVDTYNKAADTYNAKPADQRDPAALPPKPGEFSDPGQARMKEAQETLAEARRQRNAAAETARVTVRAARDAAPPKPSYAEQVVDGTSELALMRTHFGGGIVKGTAGLLSFARSVNPVDPYNITHPAEYALSLNNTAAGLVQVANDPWGAGKQMVTGFMKDPAEGLGRLVPDLALTAATGGAGAGVKAARLAKEAADLATGANRTRRLVDDAPDGTHNRPDSERTTDGTDPVDLASGHMFLPQTDVVLPGILPLVFTRRVESGYRAGRFFGPSWSSTVDERLEIDPNGVIHVTDDGLLITYPHPVPGLPTQPRTGTSHTALARDDNGDYTITDPDTGLVRHFTAPPGTEPGDNGDAWLIQTTDRNNNTLTIDRTDDGTPVALAHSAGHHLGLALTDGLVTRLALLTPTAARGEALTAADQRTAHPLRTYGYTDGNLTTVTKPSGAALTFVYDGRHRVTAWTDSNNSRYSYAYDDLDRVAAAGGEAGHFQLTLAYGEPDPSTGNRTTTLTTSDGRSTRHLVDGRCRIQATTDALGNTTRDAFDAAGNRLTHTDALGHTTTFGYDVEGRVSEVTQADGTRLRVARNRLGLVTELVEPDGSRRLQEFDDCGNRTAVTEPGGSTTRYTYDPAGRVTSVTDALGNVTEVRCDTAGLPAEITDPLGGITRYARDSLGRPVRVTDPLGAVTLLRWTVDGELAERTGPDGATESWTHDGEGNLLTHTDPIGGTSRFEYTHFDLLVARTDPNGSRYEFTHDSALRLIQVTNPQGLTWSYTYDRAGRLVSETDFDGRTVGYTVDAAGRMTASVTPLGETVSYAHDALGRVIRKDVVGRVTTFAYDAAGRLVQASGPGTELIYQYDRAGRVKTELADGRATTYAYDVLGRRTRRVTPTGRCTTYGYDAAGRPTELAAGERRITFIHDGAGRELERAFGDAFTLASTWDEAGRLSTQHLAGRDRTALNSRAYTYRADGYLTGLDDSLNGAHLFALDSAGRVIGVTAANWSESYAYDAAGNQTAATWPSSHPGHDATGLRSYIGTTITRAGNTRYEHDAAGRVTLRQKTRLSRKPDTWRYQWDAEDRLTAVTTPDGTRWRYRYDPLGRRAAKERLGADHRTVVEETRFIWDGTTLCEQTTTTTELPRPVVLTWDYQGLRPLAQTERILSADASPRTVDERFFAIVTNLVGAPTELIDEAGSLAWHTRTTLWGTTTWARHSTAYTPLRFPGQYYDPETGLHHNHHRHYDPETARYLTPDPLGLAPAPNPSTYVHNPHTWSDPLGLAPRCLNNTGREGKDGNENFVPGSAEGQRLAEQLRRESAGSIFNENGWLTPEAIADSRRVIEGQDIGNPRAREAMTSDGSNLSDWGKYTTKTHQSPYGDFQVHYYYNPETGRVLQFDYKVIMNRR